MDISIHIEGEQELYEKINKLAKQLDPEVVEPILMEGAGLIASAAKANAPQGPTGNLKKGIETRQMSKVGNNPRSAMARVNLRRASHALWIEYGTSKIRYPGGSPEYTGKHPSTSKVLVSKFGQIFGAHVKPIPAHPFFRPAWDSNKNRVLSRIADSMKRQIEKICT